MERIKEWYTGIQFTGRFALKSMGKETGLLMHCSHNGKSFSFVLDHEYAGAADWRRKEVST